MRCLLPVLAALGLAGPAGAQAVPPVKEILLKSIAVPTVAGRGEVPRLARYYASVLKAAGYTDAELAFVQVGETGYFTATLKGRASDRPILLLAHMDVVEAKATDWTRDPFIPVEDGGYIFGRGAEDNKYDVAMMVAAMARLKQQGFRPRQDLVLLLTGDEETEMATTAAAAQAYRHAGLVLNGDGGGTSLDEENKPLLFRLQAGEKTYADYRITMTDPGGHSSMPTATNPIYRMSRALGRLEAYRFPPMQNPLTRGALAFRARSATGALKTAIATFLADPRDRAAADLISASPDYVGQVRTTCVATMIEGGHAANALPQKAQATVNCRIFPGVGVEAVLDELKAVLAEPAMEVTILDKPLASDASPLRDDVVGAVKAALAKRMPGLDIVPEMEAGATDSLYFRALGIPSYGVSSLAMRNSDHFLHGLDERVPVAGMDGALVYWIDLVKALAR